jgi:hypothetical protein
VEGNKELKRWCVNNLYVSSIGVLGKDLLDMTYLLSKNLNQSSQWKKDANVEELECSLTSKVALNENGFPLGNGTKWERMARWNVAGKVFRPREP